MTRLNWNGVLLACLAFFALTDTSRADAVLVDASQMLTGTQSVVVPITVTGAGTVTATLTDLAWTERFASLSFAVATVSGVLQRLDGPGVLTFEARGPGQYFVHVFGRASGVFNLGLFGLNVYYKDNAPAVPLPAAGWLLLGGLAALRAGTRRRRGISPVSA